MQLIVKLTLLLIYIKYKNIRTKKLITAKKYISLKWQNNLNI